MQQLQISTNGRYLEYADGSPFFYLADTAWELFHRLNREEARHYLSNRARKGFTVIQAVVLAEFDGLHTPNAYGECPLIDDDPARPNEKYFAHVDEIVRLAAGLGLQIGMLPTWGDKVGPKSWGIGPEVFTPANAYTFGAFLGDRYRNEPIIWVLGGDRPVETEVQRSVWRSMAAGIGTEDGGNHLITFHPTGGRSSSEYVHDEEWLDFNMLQSGHNARHSPNYKMVLADRDRQPIKPVLDGEPRYEDHPIDWKPETFGWFTDADVREATYWSLFAGACGITYGCHDIWQFWHPGLDPISFARTDWRVAIDLPGSNQMPYARALYESRPFTRLAPYQEAIAGGDAIGGEQVRVARSDDGTFLFVYLPEGAPVTLHMDAISGSRVKAHWLDPRTGEWSTIGPFANTGEQAFTPPTHGDGQDWVLVLDDSGKNYPLPTYPWVQE